MGKEWRMKGLIGGLDPGTHSGVVLGKVRISGRQTGEFDLQITDKMEIEGRGFLGELRAVKEIADVLEVCDWVVCEDFILAHGGGSGRGQSSKREGLSPVRIGFGVFCVLQERGWEGVWEWQTPAAAKGAVPDGRLRSAGLWFVGQQHARDAARHILLWIRKAAAVPV